MADLTLVLIVLFLCLFYTSLVLQLLRMLLSNVLTQVTHPHIPFRAGHAHVSLLLSHISLFRTGIVGRIFLLFVLYDLLIMLLMGLFITDIR